MESGWVPSDRATLHSIRSTLETGFQDFYVIVQLTQFTQLADPQPSLQEVR
jgi:hypothetical protein